MVVQLLAAAIGVWLMFAPPLLSLGPATSDLLWLLGPLAASFGVMAASPVLRGLRRINVVIGLAAVIGPWIIGAGPLGSVATVVSGMALVGIGLVPSRVPDRFGGGWRAVIG